MTKSPPLKIFAALNEYRQVHGSQILTWDEKLGIAQDRAAYLNNKKQWTSTLALMILSKTRTVLINWDLRLWEKISVMDIN